MNSNNTSQSTIHPTLARSYVAYFVASIVGLCADTLSGFGAPLPYATGITVACFALGALLIFWAQYTSRATKTVPDARYFFAGPYRYMRNPTHLGILLLVVGYTVVSGSIIFCAITLIGYLVSNIFFQKYEAILDRTYGQEYQSYKARVPKIF